MTQVQPDTLAAESSPAGMRTPDEEPTNRDSGGGDMKVPDSHADVDMDERKELVQDMLDSREENGRSQREDADVNHQSNDGSPIHKAAENASVAEPHDAVHTNDQSVSPERKRVAEAHQKSKPGYDTPDKDASHRKRNEEDDRVREKERGRDKDKSRDRDRGDGRDRYRGRDDDRERDRGRDRDKAKERGRDRDRDYDRRDKDRDRDRDRDSKRDRKERYRSRSRSRDRKRRSRSRERSKRRDRSRSNSRDRQRRRNRSRSPSKEHDRSNSRKSRQSRSRSRSRRRSNSADYGGYVPRKRQDVPARTGLVLPTSANGTNNDPFYYLRQSNAIPTNPQDALRLWQEQQLRSRQLVLQQQAASAAAAASKTQREVYVGNLLAGCVTDTLLRQLFNSALAAAFPGADLPGMEPVVNVSMHSDGRYAFVELRTPEMATAALELSGRVQLLGQNLSVGRPSGYVDPVKASMAAQQAAAALAAFTAGDSSVAPIPANVPAVPAPVVSPAIHAIHSPGVPSPAPIIDPCQSMAPTAFLCVTGMVTVDVLADDQEYLDILEDLQAEAGKYALVLQLKIPRPPAHLATQLFGTGNFGKAYLQFGDAQGAATAKDGIHGRMFAGSVVNAYYINPAAYAAVV